MNTAKRPPHARLAASVALALLVAGATLTASLPSLAATTPQPLITEVQPVDGLLRISGFNFGGVAPAVTLGGRVLRVVSVTSTGVDAVLPEMAPGSYLLTLSVGSGGSQRNDEFWVALGALGPQGPAGVNGAIGPQGPAGPAGATGQQGLAGPVGPQGMTGAQGATGIAGARGLDGASGSNGMQGPPGPQGPAGAQGPMGPEGSAGSTGTPSTFFAIASHLWVAGDETVVVRAECPPGSVVTGGHTSSQGGYGFLSGGPEDNGWVAAGVTPLFPSQYSYIQALAICLRIN